MAKNFASIYSGQSDSVGLAQQFFLKEESVRGTLIIPTSTDFMFTRNGGSVNHQEPIESSDHRSGRHHNSIIREKTVTEWSIPSYFNVDTTLGAISTSEIDEPVRALLKSLLGSETIVGGGLVYSPVTAPDSTFSLFENLDVVGLQSPGCYVEAATIQMPGDGRANIEYSGRAKTSYRVGIAKSTVNNSANTVTVQTGEGKRFPVGGKVMVIKSDGTTRSTDTPNGSARTVTAVSGDVVTVDGAVLADADGSSSPVYLCYYEPAYPFSVINDPQTGLDGTISVVGLGSPMDCVRNLEIQITNNHEPQDFCYGERGLGGRLFTPAGRLDVNVSMELNLSKSLVGFINGLTPSFTGEDITAVVGLATGRRMQILLPKVKFAIPEIPVPETGTVPVSFEGLAYQSAYDAGDEITIKFL